MLLCFSYARHHGIGGVVRNNTWYVITYVVGYNLLICVTHLDFVVQSHYFLPILLLRSVAV
jgi:hypothetical protein